MTFLFYITRTSVSIGRWLFEVKMTNKSQTEKPSESPDLEPNPLPPVEKEKSGSVFDLWFDLMWQLNIVEDDLVTQTFIIWLLLTWDYLYIVDK